MIPLLTREAVRALDADAVERIGLPSIVLMENAARGVADAIAARHGSRLSRVVVVGGVGQNGGDGWVLCRQLRVAGHRPLALLVGDETRLRGDARVNWDALEPAGVERRVVSDAGELDAGIAEASLVVDALFGTGLDRPIEGRYAQAVEAINRARAPVVALDLPSGVDADTGGVLGCAVEAALTVTFAAHKLGLHQHPGAGLAGEVVVAPIGVPGPAEAEAGLIEDADVARWLPPRPLDAHKGQAGHVLVIAGTPGTAGAAMLSGLGALRSGAGLVTLAPRGGARATLEGKVAELMTAELPADGAATAARALCDGKQAVVIGPGLGTDAAAAALCRELGVGLELPAVLDADALTAFAGDPSPLREAAGPRVLTPHPGEAARLLGTTTAAVQADRYAAARRIAADSGAVVVLKGARSLVADPAGRVAVSAAGSPAMATAGMGDVLSGCVGALLPRLGPFEAAAAGVQIHGRAGELAATGDRGLLASELAAALPRALLACRGA